MLFCTGTNFSGLKEALFFLNKFKQALTNCNKSAQYRSLSNTDSNHRYPYLSNLTFGLVCVQRCVLKLHGDL